MSYMCSFIFSFTFLLLYFSFLCLSDYLSFEAHHAFLYKRLKSIIECGRTSRNKINLISVQGGIMNETMWLAMMYQVGWGKGD